MLSIKYRDAGEIRGENVKNPSIFTCTV